VPAASIATLPAEFRAEPELALAAGEDGLDLVHRLLAEAGVYLKKNGVMVVEVGHERSTVEAAYPHLPLTWLTTSAGDDMVFLYTRQK
jgi:ribosomal protein L3 glutamine methyltransferase